MLRTWSAACHGRSQVTQLLLSRGQDECPLMVSERRWLKEHLAVPHWRLHHRPQELRQELILLLTSSLSHLQVLLSAEIPHRCLLFPDLSSGAVVPSTTCREHDRENISLLSDVSHGALCFKACTPPCPRASCSPHALHPPCSLATDWLRAWDFPELS